MIWTNYKLVLSKSVSNIMLLLVYTFDNIVLKNCCPMVWLTYTPLGSSLLVPWEIVLDDGVLDCGEPKRVKQVIVIISSYSDLKSQI